MELQLGHALPITHKPMKDFDLNNNGFVAKEDEMVRINIGCFFDIKNHVKQKRSFTEAFEENGGVPTQTSFPLLSWNGHPNEEDDPKERKKTTSNTSIKGVGEERHVVGWPPIKSCRKKLLHGHQGGRIAIDRTAERGSGRTNSMYNYVKVKMEGVAIGRKIDLRLYHSYQTLTNTLITMFAKYQNIEKDGACYTLLYQDKRGDWLLVGDVPWRTFIESVQCMEIIRNAN